MNQQKKHPITLKQSAVKFLRDMVSATGWAKTTSDIILGGRLLVDIIPENTEPPPRPGHFTPDNLRIATEAWANTPLREFELSQKEYDACRKAIDYFAGQGSIPPTPAGAELLLAFGYEVSE
jgi:hypothetical protein